MQTDIAKRSADGSSNKKRRKKLRIFSLIMFRVYFRLNLLIIKVYTVYLIKHKGKSHEHTKKIGTI